MTSLIRVLCRAAFALITLVSFDAQAVPIVFEFGGTVSQVTLSTWGGGEAHSACCSVPPSRYPWRVASV